MRHFIFEEKEYRIKPRFRRARRTGDSALELAKLLRAKKKQKSPPPRVARIDRRQNCVAKMHYSFSMGAHAKQLERYLSREGTGRDGGPAALYGDNIAEYKANMAAKNFRIFLSPQDGNTDLSALAEKFIENLEIQTGFRLWWAAANHYNTAHPHAHLLINGRDKDGKDVKIPRDVVKTFMREAARDICTAMNGERTAEEMRLEKEASLKASRWTRHDERVAALLENGKVAKDDVKRVCGESAGERYLERLEHLKGLGLCAYRDGAYVFKPNWEEDLRNNGRYNTYIASREKLQYSRPADYKIYKGGYGPKMGRITKVYKMEEDSDSHAVVLESLDGKAYYIPLYNAPPYREGELVTVYAKEGQKGRLAPSITKLERRDAAAVALRNPERYKGKLAAELLSGSEGKEEMRRGR